MYDKYVYTHIYIKVYILCISDRYTLSKILLISFYYDTNSTNFSFW